MKQPIRRLKTKLRRIYYKLFHNIKTSEMNDSILPVTGKGNYVSVYSKGNIIQIKTEPNEYEHLKYDEIRIIPYQPNHGIMVERFINGKLIGRNSLDIIQLNKDEIYYSNIEHLIKRKEKLND